jgi:large subunit ribosomal protein L22
MEVLARARFVRRTPRKVRQVADLIRGLRVEDALTTLKFASKQAAVDVAKVVSSAAANADHNHNLALDELYVKRVMVDEGPRAWRIRYVSRGRTDRYARRMSHITVVVEDQPERARRGRSRRSQERQKPAAAAVEGVE